MFSLLSCVETFKEIEIFVEQYCINCKGIEQNNIFWFIWMGFRIFRILNKRLYLVYLWGRPLLFWKLGDENFSKANNFFSVSLSVKTFFSGVIFLQTIFFMPAKNLVGLFLLLQTNFSGFPPPPPPRPSKSVRSTYGLQRTNLLT